MTSIWVYTKVFDSHGRSIALPRSDGTVDMSLVRLPADLEGLREGPVILTDRRVLAVPVGHRLEGCSLLNPEELRFEKNFAGRREGT